jgi:hypothetical protein
MCRSRCSGIGLVSRALDDDVLLSEVIEELGLTQNGGADAERLKKAVTWDEGLPNSLHGKPSEGTSRSWREGLALMHLRIEAWTGA